MRQAVAEGRKSPWMGLRLVPTGGLLIVFSAAALLRLGTVTSSTLLNLAMVLTGAAVVFTLALRGRAGSDSPIGAASEVRRLSRFRWLAFPLLAVAAVLDLSLAWRVSLLALVSGFAFLAYWRLTGAGRPWWPVLAALVAATGLTPALGWLRGGAPAVALAVGAIGLALVCGGLLEHLVGNGRTRQRQR